MNKTWFETLCAAAGGIAGFLFGAADGFFYALVAFIALDYVTGVARAVMEKKLSSRAGFGGICKKALMFAVVALANIIDVQVIGAAGNGVLRSATISLFLANEGLSILENASSAGLPVPRALMNALERLKNTKGNDND
ncbi:MAG: phage holin family protein [Oscillospiraceae bacterium]|jgi:toxin secretion/phage lysis holin|nr:phage holin family protein [Oscillospiraceae bacterium]